MNLPETDDASDNLFSESFEIKGSDFISAGRVSIAVKNLLKGAGLPADILRRAAIVAYEAEMNVVLYGGDGTCCLHLSPKMVKLVMEDHGPGIKDLDLAMQEGWSHGHLGDAGDGLRRWHGPAQYKKKLRPLKDRHRFGAGHHFAGRDRYSLSKSAAPRDRPWA